jgi:AraC-like DNA-binding protein
MARPSKEPPSPSALLPALLRYVRARGLDAGFVALRGGVDAECAELDVVGVAPAALGDALAAAAELLGEPHLGLVLPEVLPLRRVDFAELATRTSATVGDALAHVVAYAQLVFPQLEGALGERTGGGEVTFSVRTRGHPRGVGRAAHEYALAYPLAHCRRESGAPLHVERVWFVNARPHDLTALYRFFGTRDVAFGAPDSGFTLAREALAAPMRGRDARLLATAEQLADAAMREQPRVRDLAILVTAKLEAALPVAASVDEVARAMRMSPRTLQRRLEDEGTRFAELLDAVRERMARAALAGGVLSLAEIAARLGFADLATFSRAFKRWTGMPPGQWRRATP